MIVIDTETTGLDPSRHRMVSLAALHIESGGEFYTLIRLSDDAEEDLNAMRVHGLSREELSRMGREEAEAMRVFGDWLMSYGRQEWCGVNPHFDKGFLEAAFMRAGVDAKLSRKPVCIQTMAWLAHCLGRIRLRIGYDGLPSRSLDSILSATGMARSGIRHSGIEDVRLTGAVFDFLMKRIFPATPRLSEVPSDWRRRVEEMFPEINIPMSWHELDASVRNAVLEGGE